jgi:hypothetical protein
MKPSFIGLLLFLALLTAGCGPSKNEREALERQRRELEEKSRAETERGNKAITDMNKKLGRKAPNVNLGVRTQTEPTSPAPVQDSK